MRIRSIKFYLKEGAISLFKNRLMTLASIGTIASCVLLFIISFCTIANINFILEQIESTVGISVFPADNLTDEQLDAFEQKLRTIDNVVEVKYISPEQALKSMEEDFGEDSAILEGFEKDNPLSKSYEIKANAPENSKQVISDIKRIGSDVRKVKEAEGLVNMLINISNALSVIGIVVVVILSVISIVIVMNTIKLTVYVRRKEINIMKYVGATDWFIRWPFIIEGIFIGLIGSVLPVIITWLVYSKVSIELSKAPIINGLFSLLEPWQIFPIIIPTCIIVGAVLGMFGSIYSVRKHLNV